MILCIIDNGDEENIGYGETFDSAYYAASSNMTTQHTPDEATFYDCSEIKTTHEVKFYRKAGV